MSTRNSWNNAIVLADVSFNGGTFNVGTDNIDYAVNIGTTATSGRTVTIGSSTSASSLALNCGTGGITVGNSANAHATTVGSTNSTSSTTIQSGSGNLNITSTNGGLNINSGSGNLFISTDGNPTTVNIATGAGNKTTVLGSTNGTSTTTLQAGSGGIVLSGATAYAPICGGTSTTNPIQYASSGINNSGYVLTSNGVASLPSFQASPSSSISLTGDTGGALTGNAFTLTAGATGLSFSGSGTTETLVGTLAASHGGTGTTTLTGVLTGNGTGSFTASPVTQYDVLVGGASNAVTSISPATTGYVLTSNGTSANPTFQASAAGNITVTGDTGGALSGSGFTFTGGSTGLAFGGSGTTQTLTFSGITANGGTVSLATDATGSTVNVGTGAGSKTTTVGSTTSTSQTTIQSGSNALTLTTNGGNANIMLTPNGTGHVGTAANVYAAGVSFDGGSNILSTYVASTSWTPVLKFGGGTTGITYTTQLGSYCRVGDIVAFSMRIVLSSKGSSTGNATITGLSFSPSTGLSAVALRAKSITTTGTIECEYDGTSFNFESLSSGTITIVKDTAFANTSDLTLSGTIVL
jgi:hypothetical protein